MFKMSGGGEVILGLAYKPRGELFESVAILETDKQTDFSSPVQINNDQMDKEKVSITEKMEADGDQFTLNKNEENKSKDPSTITMEPTDAPDGKQPGLIENCTVIIQNSDVPLVICTNGSAPSQEKASAPIDKGPILRKGSGLSLLSRGVSVDSQRKDSVTSIPRGYDRSLSFSYFSEQVGLFAQLAVHVEDAHLTYGRGKKVHHALRGIDLRVPEGAIYGLLGPSGCGKTTLLNCVIGKFKLKRGSIDVFGNKPGSSKSIIPGRGVGYMPQELSLYQEFTIEETLTFFGRLHQIGDKTLKERTDFLLKFLDLPPRSRLVQNLSGGQQRRVSLAAALIHQPPLLILDEPTVGVDPLLRQNIWSHLVELTSKEGMTVIITTHYIEEARQANVVGLMRKGRLLAEASPSELVQHFDSISLEDCFLKLCMMDKETKQLEVQGMLDSVVPVKSALLQRSMSNASNKLIARDMGTITEEERTKKVQSAAHNNAASIANSTMELIPDNATDISDVSSERKRFVIPHRPNSCVDGSSKIATLLNKNLTRLRRNPILLLFQFALPAVQVVLLCLCIGGNPFDLTMAVVNNEFPQSLSVRYLSFIDKGTIIQKPYDDLETAMETVRSGKHWGVIHIDRNFSRSLMRRFQDGLDVSNETIIESSIKIHLDMTNQQIGLIIQKTLLESFQAFSRDMLDMIGSTPLLANLPVTIEKPIYGEQQTSSFTEFIAPGVVLSITYIMAVGLTSLSFVDERKSGLYDRGWVSGVTAFQVLTSHVFTQSIVLIFQVLAILVFTFLVFEIPSRGPFIWVVVLTISQGVCGMSFGLLISSICSDESTAVMLAMSAFFPNLILCGIVWPIEGQPHFMRYLSICLPQTMPTEALRAVLSRGWGVDYSVVWGGLLVTWGWIIFFLFAAGLIQRLRK